MKFASKLTAFSVGSWGLISGLFFRENTYETFIGMICPLMVGIITVILVQKTYLSKPENLTKFMSGAFFIKLLIYGVYVTLIIGYFHFDAKPFIISFVGYFSVLHILEAMYFRTLFNKNQDQIQ